MSQDESAECPLCMETLELDDLSFFPCTCGYQICRFCWHRLRTDENGLCPACRKQYTEDPANFKPLSVDEIQQKAKSERKAKKQRLIENRKHLANVRVVQKNLVFVVGIPSRLACSDQLKKQDCFGRFGKIHKVVVNQSTSYAGVQGPSASAYVTYLRGEDALTAIQGVNNVRIEGKTLKASLGTTKYCNHFLKGSQCPKGDCMYLHELGDEDASFTKEQMQAGKHTEYERRLHAQLIASKESKDQRVSSPTNSDRLSESGSQKRTRHKSEGSSEEPSSSDDQKSSTPLSERSDSPDIAEDSPSPGRCQDGDREEEEDEEEIETHISQPNSYRKERVDSVEDEDDEEEDDENDDERETHEDHQEHSMHDQCHQESSGFFPSLADGRRNVGQSEPIGFTQPSSSNHPLSSPVTTLVNSDIELDFDPFYISRKGLADLIEHEQSSANRHESPRESVPQMANLPSSFGNPFPYGGMSMRPSPPGMKLQSTDRSLNMFQNFPGSSNQQPSTIHQQGSRQSPQNAGGSLRRAPPPGFGGPGGLMHGGSPMFGSQFGSQSNVLPMPSQQIQSQPPIHHTQQYFSRFAAANTEMRGNGGNTLDGMYGYRNFYMQSSNPCPREQQADNELQSMKEQQDQLRQLLPSVNISFGPPPSQSLGSMAHPPPGLHGFVNLQRQQQQQSTQMHMSEYGNGMGMGGVKGNMRNNGGWPESLHDPAVLSTSRQNAATTVPEQQRIPPYY